MLEKSWTQQPIRPLAEGDTQCYLMRTVLHTTQLAEDIVVRIPNPQGWRHVQLRERGNGITFIQPVARYTGILALEYGDAAPPAATDPEAVCKHKQRIHVNACRPLEIFFYK